MLIYPSTGVQEQTFVQTGALTASREVRMLTSGRAACASENPWALLHPADLFSAWSSGSSAFWTCVRTRPRWEKKFAAFLLGRDMPHFLPLYCTETHSGRKTRRSWQPLFPGYVFVRGEQTKTSLNAAAMVVRLLQPRGPHQVEQLHRDLTAIWQHLAQGISLVPTKEPAVGELCEITSGPLRGVRGIYERPGKQGRLILTIEMLSMGTAVEVPCGQVEPIRE